MTDQEARALANAYVQALSSQSVDKLLSLCTEEVAYTGLLVRKITADPAGTVRGKAAVRKFLQEVLPEFSGCSIGHIANGVSSVVIETRVPGFLPMFIALILDQAGSVNQVLMHMQIP
jgi:hypothetical protein